MTTTTMAPEMTPTLTMSPKSLADALAAVKGAATTRSAIAALSGVRIFTLDGAAYMETTDREVYARKRLATAVYGESLDALVSHSDLSKAAKLFAKRESVRLEAVRREQGSVVVTDVRVTDGKRTIVLQSLRMQDFPAFPSGDEAPLLYTATARELGAVLERAARFASSDGTRPILTGIAFYVSGDAPRVWATDSYRLCDLAAPATGHADEATIVNVGARGLVMAAKLMRKSTEPVTITTVRDRGEYALVRHGDMTIAVRTIDGQYPRFHQLIPDSCEVELSVPIAELAGACEVAVAFSRKNAPMRLSLNGSIKVSGTTHDVAEFEEVLSGASYVESGTYMDAYGGELVIGFNAEFFADIVKCHESDTATLRLLTPLRPGLFIDGDDRYLLMPIRLNV